MTSPSPMKSPDRDAADDLIVRLETFQRAAVTQQAHDLFREAASELATLRDEISVSQGTVAAQRSTIDTQTALIRNLEIRHDGQRDELAILRSRERDIGQLLAHVHLHLTNDEEFDADEFDADIRKIGAGKWIDTESILIEQRSELATLRRRVEEMEKAMERARSLIDAAMGDTDPNNPADPLLDACQTLSAALSPPTRKE